MTVIVIICEVLLAYLMGSIPSAVWVGKLFYNIDVRKHGSGNAGATNVIRVLGYKAGIPVLIFDVFKGWMAVQIVNLYPIPEASADLILYVRIMLAFAAVIGHVFPVFAGFRGGKGVGTIAGAAIALYPLAIPLVLAIFVTVLATTRYVSLSSITAALVFPVTVIFIIGEHHTGLDILSVVVAIFIPFTHRKNIVRLIRREEKRFDFSRKSKETGKKTESDTTLEN